MVKRSNRQQNSDQPEKVRLNRFLSECGIASRRNAENLIQEGKIKVNKEITTDLSTKVSDEDVVECCGKPVKRAGKVYLMVNKPKDYITTKQDPEDRKTVMDLLKKKRDLPQVYPIGRLDRNTSGLLLMTNDGELANKLMHPSRKVEKMYSVTLDKPISKKEMKILADGITVDNDFIAADNILYPEPGNKKKVFLSIHSGQNKIVRRMFKTLGYDVKNLDRVYYGGLKKEKLKPGEWRYLSKKEINILKNVAGIKK